MYGLLIWHDAYSTYANKISRLQNKAIKLIAKSKRTDKCAPIYEKHKILQLHDLHIHETATFMYKFHNNKLPVSFSQYFNRIAAIHSIHTRSNTSGLTYYIPQYKTTHRQRSLKYTGVKIWNKTPNWIRTKSYSQFLKHLKLYLYKATKHLLFLLSLFIYFSIFFFALYYSRSYTNKQNNAQQLRKKLLFFIFLFF